MQSAIVFACFCAEDAVRHVDERFAAPASRRLRIRERLCAPQRRPRRRRRRRRRAAARARTEAVWVWWRRRRLGRHSEAQKKSETRKRATGRGKGTAASRLHSSHSSSGAYNRLENTPCRLITLMPRRARSRKAARRVSEKRGKAETRGKCILRFYFAYGQVEIVHL